MSIYVGSSIVMVSSVGLTCSSTPYDSQTLQDDSTAVGTDAVRYYCGSADYSPASNKSVCRIDIYIYSIIGDVSAKTYNMKIFTMSGTSLGTLLGTSGNVSGASITATTWIQFSFSTPVNIASGTNYGIVITASEADVNNYIKYGDYSAGTLSGVETTWYSDLSLGQSWAGYDPCLKLYAME